MMKTFLRDSVVFLLTLEAKAILKKYKPEIIAVTGSVGKTATKDAIFTALSNTRTIRKSEKSYNSDIGVPLTVLGEQNQWGNVFGWLYVLLKGAMYIAVRQPYPETLVMEVGTDHPGDIEKIAAWLRPHTVVFTGVSDVPVHVGNFPSVEAVFEEKKKLIEHMREGGTLIVNADNARARSLNSAFAGTFISYGMTEGDVRIAHIEPQYANETLSGTHFEVTYKGEHARCELRGVVGSGYVSAVVAGMVTAISRGTTLSDAAKRFQEFTPLPGRMRILRGTNDSVIIDDTYNASPAASVMALETLANVRAKRRIAVLGDMRELGAHSKEAHEMVGRRAAEVLDVLVTVGEESRVLADAARTAGLAQVKSYGYGDAARAGEELRKELRAGDMVLVKGSQNQIRLEKCVEKIMAEPERAGELLVRQEPEWKFR